MTVGGDEEDRTLDLTDANRTLSQLSYAPIFRTLVYHKTFSGKSQEFFYYLSFIFDARPVAGTEW